MKRIMLIGPSRCGKTSLTQCWRGETLHYQKRRRLSGPRRYRHAREYLENRCLYSALLTSACDAEVIALVLNADAACSPFSPGFTAPMNRPTLGIVTKSDLASPSQISCVRTWLEQAGAQQVFITSSVTKYGFDEMAAFLNAKESL